jgi:membrane dipeptidase
MLRFVVLIGGIFVSTTGFSASEQAQQLAEKYLIADTHIDLPFRLERMYEDATRRTQMGQFDYPRAIEGGLNVPFMSIYIPAKYEEEGGGKDFANLLIDRVEALVGRAPEKYSIPHSTSDVYQDQQKGLVSLAMGMENGTPLEGDLDNLGYFHGRGIRYITLTHSKSNHISDSSYDDNKHWQGLSPFGKTLIPAMNKAGMMIDVSHISDDAFYQVMDLSQAPVIASHSSARKFTPGFERNMSDEMIRLLAKNGGVIQINFGTKFLSQEAIEWSEVFDAARRELIPDEEISSRLPELFAFMVEYRKQSPYPFADMELVLDHFDHVVALGGIDSVGIGSDYDGVGDTLPIGLKDVSSYPNLIDGLLGRGYSESDIEKILGGNLMRVWKQVENFTASAQ